MKQNRIVTPLLVLVLIGLIGLQSVSAQCSYYPVSLEERVANSKHVVIGRLLSQESYWDRKHENIYTLNTIQVTAYLKGHLQDQQIGVITRGGTLEFEAMISYPSLQLDPYNEYILFLQDDNFVLDHPGIRSSNPSLLQVEPYADGQGAITKQSGTYHDLLVLPELDEAQIMGQIKVLTMEDARTPSGEKFTPRLGDTYPLSDFAASQRGGMPITSFAPATTRTGTIVPADFITITGSGFGAAAGTVFYTNADDGGATFTSSGVASDNTAWADGSITNKPARRGGTGPINVNGAMQSGSNLTVQYAHLDINSTFSGFGSSTRQRYYLRNMDGGGGYSFQYNTTFNTDVAAKAAFERAIDTWRCATFVDFQPSATTTAIAVAALDGVNAVVYEVGLPAGVLGRATSRFSGSGNAGCNLANTVWWTAEIDVEFKPNPPSAGFTWEFGPTNPSASEFDFESVALHELGHAHGLGHVIAPGTVMHFALTNGANVRTLTANDIAGGNAKMAYSTAATCFNPAGSGTPMIALTAGNCSLLDVQDLSFDGWNTPGLGNEINWSIEDKANVVSFSLERRQPGGQFVEITEIAATQTGTFTYLDTDISQSTTWQYRLAVNLADGHSDRSDILTISYEMPERLEVHPTLTSGWVFVKGRHTAENELSISILDLQGKELLRQVLNPESGVVYQRVDLSTLGSGVYLYKINGGAAPKTGKLVVQD